MFCFLLFTVNSFSNYILWNYRRDINKKSSRELKIAKEKRESSGNYFRKLSQSLGKFSKNGKEATLTFLNKNDSPWVKEKNRQ